MKYMIILWTIILFITFVYVTQSHAFTTQQKIYFWELEMMEQDKKNKKDNKENDKRDKAEKEYIRILKLKYIRAPSEEIIVEKIISKYNLIKSSIDEQKYREFMSEINKTILKMRDKRPSFMKETYNNINRIIKIKSQLIEDYTKIKK